MDKIMYINSTKNIQHNKKADNSKESRTIFSWLYDFYRLNMEQQIQSRPKNKAGKKKTHIVKTQLMVNNCDIIILKAGHKKKQTEL